MNDLAARLKAKGYAPASTPSFPVPSFSLEEDYAMTEIQQQRIRVVLEEALGALKAIGPHLDADSLERSVLGQHCIRWVLRELDKLEDDGDA